MSTSRPCAIFNRDRSAFALINPETELYTYKFGRANHVAISYAWSDWRAAYSSALPDWANIRLRLRDIVGPTASTFIKVLTGHAQVWWLDIKCIDQAFPEDKAY